MNCDRGYTLLEMVVVVAVMAMATALVAPAGYRMIATWREASDVDAALEAVAALPMQARREGRTLTFSERDDGLPQGWSLSFDTPLVVRGNGACNAAKGELRTARQTIDFEVGAPFCDVQRLAPGG